MGFGRPIPPVTLSSQLREQLQAMERSRSRPQALAQRARIILLAADGLNNSAVVSRLGLSRPTVSKWRQRFLRQGLVGLHDEAKPGGPRSISDDQVASLIRRTLEAKPKDGTHWTCRSLAAETKVSRATVYRIWRAFGLQPHRQKHFKLSTAPFFVEKVRDIVGLYLNPPDKAMVLWVDEKSHIEALDRTQPLLPLGLGYVEGVTPDYVRHGTRNF